MKKKVSKFLIRQALRFKRFDPKKTILILSEARGGSTWLMEILAHLYDANIHWEPFHVRRGLVPRSFNLGWHPHVPVDNDDQELEQLFKDIHSMKLHNEWSRRYLGLKKLISSDQLLVKYVRANLMLPYFLDRYQFDNKPVFLIRHPVDTCISFIKAFDNHPDRPEIQLVNDRFREEILEHQEFMNSLNSRLEVVIAHWCLNNCPTLSKLSDLDAIVVFYSDLVLDPEKEIKRIVKQFKTEPVAGRLDQINFRRSSNTDFSGALKQDPEDQLWKNLKKMSTDEQAGIQKVFDHFGLRLYNAKSPFPHKSIITSS